jgi:hypothetical protein
MRSAIAQAFRSQLDRRRISEVGMKIVVCVSISTVLTGCTMSPVSSPPGMVVSAKIASAYEGSDGRADARRDIAAGKLSFKTYSCTVVGYGTFYRLLRERFGIVEDTLSSSDAFAQRYADTYNGEIGLVVEARFGAGVIEKTWREAQVIEAARELKPDNGSESPAGADV